MQEHFLSDCTIKKKKKTDLQNRTYTKEKVLRVKSDFTGQG